MPFRNIAFCNRVYLHVCVSIWFSKFAYWRKQHRRSYLSYSLWGRK